ncbi:SusC/RagA family TonB-linked outer membrane protein [Flexithrix dorotheae]|uniref:SusC/RagA family TonB-linked outer membrane protein n=1 Tax=Flexithrix dorotheae TaxID=70993 RepID=UPI000377E736|nr:TonB-dependent receptor [Flexithrix dorotheae]
MQTITKNTLILILSLLCVNFAYSQDRLVTGTVSSSEEGGIPGASIIVKGTSVGTTSDLDGGFKLTLPESAETLVVSYIGYKSQEVNIGNQTNFEIVLELDLQQLKEVVVVGYGTQEKGVVTGAVSSVDMDDVRGLPLTNVDQALQGRVPGVVVTQTGGGAPGGATQVSIRGIGSINGETPLYVIDGIPVQQSGQDADGYSFLNNLNPNDIESIDILKDASAAAIYGSRASGGVVLITTKRGKEGPVKVNFDAYYGTQSPGKNYEVLNADQYVTYLNELHSGPDGQIPPAFENGQRPSTANTNWQEELFTAAPIQNYNLGISGGKENALFSLGFEYFDQEGTMRGTGFDRYAIRANSDFKIGKRIKIGETILLSKTGRMTNTGSGGRRPQEHAIKQAPTVPVYDPTFLGGFGHPDADEGQDARNPIADADLFTREQDRYRFWGSIYGEWEIVDHLTYKLQLGLDFGYQDNITFNPEFDQVRRLRERSSLNRSRSQDFNPLIEQFLTYNKSFGDHNLSVMAGFSAQSFQYTSISGSGEDIPNGVVTLGGASTNITVGESKVETSLRSLFGRVTYSFNDKYLLTANIRRDESSKLFRGNNPDGVFPSVSVGWRLSEESFMNGVSWISDLKFRAGYGELGNQSPLGAYPVDVNLNTDFFYILNGNTPVQGISQNSLANPDIQWEVTKQIDVGIDAGLFNNQLMVNFDYYKRNTEGLIWQQSVPPSVGLGPPDVNAGEIENSGIELALTYRKFEGDFQFDIGANITTINNNVISLVNDDLIIKSGSVTDDINNVSWTQVGEPIGTFYGWVSEGIFRNWDEVYNHAFINQATTGDTDANGNPIYDSDKRDEETASLKTAPGDIKWKDVNGDGIINNEDQVRLGSPIPDFTYGFTANANYKGLDAQLFIQGAHGHQLYNSAKRWLVDFRQNFNNGIEAASATTYRPEYTDSEPRLVRADPNRNVLRSSDRYVFEGSYARIKNLTIGYSFNNTVLDKIKAQKLRIYVTAQNLATFTNYFGLEPDVGSLSTGTARDAGIDRLIYPQPRTFILGVQVGF